jgi:hypothetical protein
MVFPKVVENLWKAWKTPVDFFTEALKNQGFPVFHTLVSTACAGWGKPKIPSSFWGGFWRETPTPSGFWRQGTRRLPKELRRFPFGKTAEHHFSTFPPKARGQILTICPHGQTLMLQGLEAVFHNFHSPYYDD